MCPVLCLLLRCINVGQCLLDRRKVHIFIFTFNTHTAFFFFLHFRGILQGTALQGFIFSNWNSYL